MQWWGRVERHMSNPGVICFVNILFLPQACILSAGTSFMILDENATV